MPKYILKCPCPCCPPGGNNTARTWSRTECGHTLYILDDGDVGCPECNFYSSIFDSTFTCCNHPNDARKPNIQYLLRCTAVIAQLAEMPYKTFKNIEKKIEEEVRKRGFIVDDD